ncbi:MAG TPA: RagB/SusD family nutrient uptake outer membrane protein [Porphyromonadaceae bacterium]|jgi:hypothetical protein|nr:RagB/SusD family nutrient uptake outer membrane protein [Porphyromonadaceae bacterium]
MKNIKNILLRLVLTALIFIVLFTSCSEDFLKPKPLSFYEPTTTFSTESGLQAAMATCDRHYRQNWNDGNGVGTPIGTEYWFSDVAYNSRSELAITHQNFDIAAGLTPSSTPSGDIDANRIGYFWQQTYEGIKFANTVINYVDNVTSLDEATKNAYKGRGYFHRSIRYLSLVFQFGDVPLVTKILEVPKQNYRSTKKEAILDMITQDMEFAIQWVPDQSEMDYVGMVNKGACRMLLIKCYLATGQWKKAKEQADILINQSDYSLMQEPFGTWNPGGEPRTWPITRNVIWDLHRCENKLIPTNKEVIMGMPNQGTTSQSFIGFQSMRIFLPFWNNTSILRSPDGRSGVEAYPRNSPHYREDLDYTRALGRGGGFMRITHFAQHGLWFVNGVDDKGDLRHSSETGNWVRMDSIKYNHASSEYRGQNLMMYHPETGKSLCADTIRSWCDWPHYKTFTNDVVAEANLGASLFNGASNGGNADWYLFRLAETYLLRAEAKFHLGDPTAKDDVNEVRKRAKCDQLYSTVTIGDIMDERARELYLEEWRNVELSRVSYCLALSGKPDEWGNTYDLETFDKQTGTDTTGGSYWYQRIMHYNEVYNKGPVNVIGKEIKWIISKHNFYWPIPESAIRANNKGELSQNYGYSGYDPNTPKWDNWQEAVADEDITN